VNPVGSEVGDAADIAHELAIGAQACEQIEEPNFRPEFVESPKDDRVRVTRGCERSCATEIAGARTFEP